MNKVKEILKAFTVAYPPPEKCHHVVYLNDQFQIVICLHLDGKLQDFTCSDPADEGKSASETVNEINELIKTLRKNTNAST